MDASKGGPLVDQVVALNVGGTHYTTSLSTLTSDPDSMLAAMFSGRYSITKDCQGNYFIDRDGALFRYVLNFLRDSELVLPSGFNEFAALMKEAEYYQVSSLIESLKSYNDGEDVDIIEIHASVYACPSPKVNKEPGKKWNLSVVGPLDNVPEEIKAYQEKPDIRSKEKMTGNTVIRFGALLRREGWKMDSWARTTNTTTGGILNYRTERWSKVIRYRTTDEKQQHKKRPNAETNNNILK